MPHEVGATERSSRSKSRDGGSGSGGEQPYSHPRSCKSTSGGVTSSVEADSKKSSTGKSKQASLPSSSSSRQQPDRAARNREASTGIIADVVAVSTVSKPQKPTPSEVFKTPTIPTIAAVAANADESKDAAIGPANSFGTGCLVCRQDDHQDKILMCENVGCEGEYHIYCLQPPLAEVPIGAWYCGECNAI
jgi:PHD-finger